MFTSAKALSTGLMLTFVLVAQASAQGTQGTTGIDKSPQREMAPKAPKACLGAPRPAAPAGCYYCLINSTCSYYAWGKKFYYCLRWVKYSAAPAICKNY